MTDNTIDKLAPTHRVLVVEDNDHTAHLLEFLFRRSGYEVQTAADGRDARSFLQESEPVDLVVLGLMLPYVSGYQVIIDIKQLPAWQHVPILVLSSKILEQDIVRALDLGANDYVTKPFRPQELLARARRLIITHESLGRRE
jgi:DNA-binding response OmpR family regulator